MKWGGIDSASPVSDEPGTMLLVQNVRTTVEGELRRRRGLSRSSLAKASGSVTAIADFALSPGSPYALTLVSGAIDGDQGISAQWGDLALTPVGGMSTLTSGANYNLLVSRGASQFATSAIIFANAGSYPTDGALGTYIGEVALNPWAASASTSWTAPDRGTWYFRVYPVANRQVGPGANLTANTINPLAVFHFLSTTFGIPNGYADTSSSAPAYTTGGAFSYGAAVAAGAITLPYTFTISSTQTASLGPVDQLQAFSDVYSSTGTPKNLNGISIPGLMGTVTINANGSTSLA